MKRMGSGQSRDPGPGQNKSDDNLALGCCVLTMDMMIQIMEMIYRPGYKSIHTRCSEQEKGDSDSRLIEGNFYYPNYTNSTIVSLDLLSLS